jgi:hypothetical protein
MDVWRRSLVAYRLYPPANLKPDDDARWLAGISATTHPTRFALLPLPPFALETVASARGIAHYVLVTKGHEAHLLAGVRAALPGARIEEAPDYLDERPRFRVAAELTMTSQARPLAVDQAEGTNANLLAAGGARSDSSSSAPKGDAVGSTTTSSVSVARRAPVTSRTYP